MRWLKWFLAGALAVPVFHQLLILVLHAAALVPRAPFNMNPTRPFGVPQVISLTFWGGVWGPIMGAVIERMRGARYWIGAIVFGAIFPTLVAIFVAAPLKGQPVKFALSSFAVGLLINGAWGFGTALFYRLFTRAR